MNANESITEALDRLVKTLDTAAGSKGGGDAITQELASAGRQQKTVSLREAEVVRQFREALTDGLIRVDTANQLLRLLNEVLVHVLG